MTFPSHPSQNQYFINDVQPRRTKCPLFSIEKLRILVVGQHQFHLALQTPFTAQGTLRGPNNRYALDE